MTWTVLSPDGTLTLEVAPDDDGRLGYRVLRRGAEVVARSPLGVVRSDTTFDRGLVLVTAEDEVVVRDRYTLVHGKQLAHDVAAGTRTLTFVNPDAARLELELRAYDEGVAFRYRFPDDGSGGERTVTRELTGVTPAAPGRVWAQPTQEPTVYGPAYENLYADGVPLGTASSGPAWDLPAAVESGGTWLLVSESGLDAGFYGSRLGAEPDGATYTFAPPLDDEGDGIGASSATSTLPWTLPWRFVVVAPDAGAMAASNLVTHLAEPSRLADTSWVRPGRVAWSWWSENDSPRDLARQRAYVDLAADLGWEHCLVDANWDVNPDADVEALARYAADRGVGLWLWYNSGGPHNHVTEAPRDRMHEPAVRQAEFAKLARWGVVGVKVDFFHSDKQDGIGRYLGILADAAEHRVMVNFHGCTIPRGWSRTWPHLMTMEGVRGGETYLFNPDFPAVAASHNAILPFTRNAVGPMDYTPVTFGDVTHPHLTTNAHELALAVVFESGLLHFADSAEAYRSLPPHVADVLRGVPVVWDETRFLVAEPGECVVVARRRGDDWWVAGINGREQPRTLELDLTTLRPGSWRVLGDGAGRDEITARDSDARDGAGRLRVDLAARGGFLARAVS
jgi:alpha-glucosidase